MKKITIKDVFIDFVGLALVAFVVAVVLMLCVGFSSNAEESTATNEYYVESWSYAQGSSNPYQARRYSITTDMRFCLLEVNSEVYGDYTTKFYAVVCSDFDWANQGYKKEWALEFFRGYKDAAMTELGFDMGTSSAYYGLLVSDVKTMSADTLALQKHIGSSGEIDTNMPIFTSVDDAVMYIETGETSGFIQYEPDIENARESGLAKLINFKADSSFFCSWSGVEGATRIDEETLETVECTTNNAFVAFEFGIATTTAPGKIVDIVKYDKYVLTSKGSFSLDASEILVSSNAYILYVKATPYTYANDDVSSRLRRGYSSYAYFDVNGAMSWTDTVKEYVGETLQGRRHGSVRLTDFYLSNVELHDGLLGAKDITWSGTTKDVDLSLIPSDDALVIATYIVTNPDYSYTVKEYATCKIADGKCSINYIDLIEESEANSFMWDGDIWLTPVYTVNGLLYQGEPTIVNMSDATVDNVVSDIDGVIGDVIDNVSGAVSGSFEINADDMEKNILSYLISFFSLLKELVGGMGSLPNMYRNVFSFMPSIYIDAIGTCLFVVIILRILGR